MVSIEEYNRLMEFARRLRPNSAISNLYLIRKYDINNNLIDTYYGMNHFTDYGFTKYCDTSTYPSITIPSKVFIGNGTGTIRRENCELLSPIMTTAMTVSDTTVDNAYPPYYLAGADADHSYITCVTRFLTTYLDFQVPDRDIRITEYGIGDAYNQLWTHSKVYDIQGHEIYITKRFLERMTFDIFLCISYPISIINSIWNTGNSGIMITKADNFTNTNNRMYESDVFSYKRNTKCSRLGIHTTSNISHDESSPLHGREYSRLTTVNSFTIYNQSADAHQYITGFCQYANGWVVMQDVKSNAPEAFDIRLRDNHIKDISATSLSDQIGISDNAPFTDMDVSHAYMYNTITKAYDNEVQFTNDPQFIYSEMSFDPSFSAPIHYTYNNTNAIMYVHMNLHTDTPIVGFKNNNIETLYATNEYWSSWNTIANPNNIPLEFQHCKYWITKTNMELQPIRSRSPFTLKPSCGDYEELGYESLNYGPAVVLDASQWGYCVRDNEVFYPIQKTRYYIPYMTQNSVNTKHIAYDKWLFTFADNGYYLTEATPERSQTRHLAYPFISTGSDINDLYKNRLVTGTNTGIICLQSARSSYHESVIIDIRNMTTIVDNLNDYKENLDTINACAIQETYKVAYVLYNDPSTLYIKDYQTNTTISYTLPSVFDTASKHVWLFGYKNYLWIATSTKTFFIDLNDPVNSESIQECIYSFDLITSQPDIDTLSYSCTDDAIIIYKHKSLDYYFNNVVYIRLDEPLYASRKLSSLDHYGKSATNYNYFNKLRHFELKYINQKTNNGSITGRTLALIASIGYAPQNYDYIGSYVTIVDFGAFLYDTNITSYIEERKTTLWYPIPFGEFIIQGERKIPIEFFMEHRIVGTTTTITAVNKIKNVRNQQFETIFSNYLQSTFDGIVPGTHI